MPPNFCGSEENPTSSVLFSFWHISWTVTPTLIVRLCVFNFCSWSLESEKTQSLAGRNKPAIRYYLQTKISQIMVHDCTLLICLVYVGGIHYGRGSPKMVAHNHQDHYTFSILLLSSTNWKYSQSCRSERLYVACLWPQFVSCGWLLAITWRRRYAMVYRCFANSAF